MKDFIECPQCHDTDIYVTLEDGEVYVECQSRDCDYAGDPHIDYENAVRLVTKYMYSLPIGYSGSGKTIVYAVMNRSQDVKLGEFNWFYRFNQFSLFPLAGTVWSMGCRQALDEWTKRLMVKQREIAKARKESEQ